MIIKLLHIFFILLIPFLAQGQITIKKSVFPEPGDTLKYTIANTPNVNVYSASSTSITWDFSSIEFPAREEVIYYSVKDSNYGSIFPEATTYTVSNGVELFYQATDDVFKQIGIGGFNLEFIQVPEALRLEGDAIQRRAGVSYGDSYSNAYSISHSEASQNLPDTIKNTLAQFSIDSIRIEFVVTQEKKFDAYGRMILPSGQVDVLRASVSEVNSPTLFAKVPVLGWQAIDLGQIQNVGALAEILQERRSKRYEFHSNDSKELAAEVEVEVNEEKVETPTQVKIKAPKPSSTHTHLDAKPVINVFPNPTFGDIVFKLTNYPTDNYRVEIYNIVGKKIESLNFKPGQPVLRTNLSHLRKGTYLYTIFNSKGEKLTTRRLVIMTP